MCASSGSDRPASALAEIGGRAPARGAIEFVSALAVKAEIEAVMLLLGVGAHRQDERGGAREILHQNGEEILACAGLDRASRRTVSKRQRHGAGKAKRQPFRVAPRGPLLRALRFAGAKCLAASEGPIAGRRGIAPQAQRLLIGL
jgi:hypothetical protein